MISLRRKRSERSSKSTESKASWRWIWCFYLGVTSWIWLVVSKMNFILHIFHIFHFVHGMSSETHWLIFFKMVKTTNQESLDTKQPSMHRASLCWAWTLGFTAFFLLHRSFTTDPELSQKLHPLYVMVCGRSDYNSWLAVSIKLHVSQMRWWSKLIFIWVAEPLNRKLEKLVPELGNVGNIFGKYLTFPRN